MDEYRGKIIGVIIGAVVMFILQSLGVHKLLVNIFGGISSTTVETYTIDNAYNSEIVFWKSTDKCGTNECYQTYLRKYPQGQFSDLAQVRLASKNTQQKKPQEVYNWNINNHSTIKPTQSKWRENSESKYLPTYLDTQILFPSMNNIVKRRQSIKGTISEFVSHEYYFLIIQSHHFGKLHYPQQELFSATWEAVGVYGASNQKYGYRYDTFIVKTSKNEEAQIIRQKMGKGLKNLPIYTEIVSNKVTTICCQ
jgi:hypothetical protein